MKLKAITLLVAVLLYTHVSLAVGSDKFTDVNEDFVYLNKLSNKDTKITKSQPLPSQVNSDDKIVQVVADSIHSVVKITDMSRNVHGTGFLIKHEGKVKVLTNYHVIEPKIIYFFELYSGERYSVSIDKIDKENDIALLYTLDKVKKDLPYLEFADEVVLAEQAILISHPFAYEFTVNLGIVSHIDRKNSIQVDAGSNFGSSGASILNSQGEIIGMVTSRVVSKDTSVIVDTITFGVKASIIQEFLNN